MSSILLTNGDELRADAVLVGVGVTPAQELVRNGRPRACIPPATSSAPGTGRRLPPPAERPRARSSALTALLPQPAYVWSDQFGLRLQVVGTPRLDDAIEIDGEGDSFAVRYLDESGAVRAALLANRRRRQAHSAGTSLPSPR